MLDKNVKQKDIDGLEKIINNNDNNSIKPIKSDYLKSDYLKAIGKGLFLPVSTIIKYRREHESKQIDILAKGTAWSEALIILNYYDNLYIQGFVGLVLISQGAHLLNDYKKRQR